MSLISFDKNNGFPSLINTDSNQIVYNPLAFPKYTGTRNFIKMKDLYKCFCGVDDNREMYFTAGDIWFKKDENKFLDNEMTYEYTVIPPYSVNGELNKTHGHIHGISEKNGKARCEAFEVLNGRGCFELFKEIDQGQFECLIINLKKGDTLIVPSDYYHLSINTSDDEYFVFADLIKTDVKTVYEHVKEKHGGPFRVMMDANKEIYYELNECWNNEKVRLKIAECQDLKWSNPFKDHGLYKTFIKNEEFVEKIIGD